MSDGRNDRRIRRTRRALLEAFDGLAMERPYDRITVADILDRADVGRSTFYEHFRNKDDVLLQSMSGLLSVLADAVRADDDTPHLERVLDHFWQNKKVARGLLEGSSAPRVRALLADLIEQRLMARCARERTTLPIPPRLVAQELASAELGLIGAWLRGEGRCRPAELADSLRAGTRGAIAARLTPRG